MHSRYRHRTMRVLCVAGILAAGNALACTEDPAGSVGAPGDHSQWQGHAGSAAPESGGQWPPRVVPRISHADPTPRWIWADASRYVDETYRAHNPASYWHHGRRDEPQQDFNPEHRCHERLDPPKPTPLPGAALLFAPGLLLLRMIQRRAA